jgi:hypothetical protein
MHVTLRAYLFTWRKEQRTCMTEAADVKGDCSTIPGVFYDPAPPAWRGGIQVSVYLTATQAHLINPNIPPCMNPFNVCHISQTSCTNILTCTSAPLSERIQTRILCLTFCWLFVAYCESSSTRRAGLTSSLYSQPTCGFGQEVSMRLGCGPSSRVQPTLDSTRTTSVTAELVGGVRST